MLRGFFVLEIEWLVGTWETPARCSWGFLTWHTLAEGKVGESDVGVLQHGEVDGRASRMRFATAVNRATGAFLQRASVRYGLRINDVWQEIVQ